MASLLEHVVYMLCCITVRTENWTQFNRNLLISYFANEQLSAVAVKAMQI
jgi:hypothetical protein